MQALRSRRPLPGHERRLLLAAGLLVPAVRLALLLLPRRVARPLVARWLRPGPPGRAAGRCVVPFLHRSTPARIGWAVRVVSACVPGATCLTQALAAQLLLRAGGHAAALRIGVTRAAAGALAAHAWVECGDVVVVGGSCASLAGYALLRPPLGVHA